MLGQFAGLQQTVARLGDAGILVSIFIAPDERQLAAAARLGAPVIELHTGAFANARGARRQRELRRLQRAADCAHDLGLLAFLGLFQLAIPCVLSVLCASVLKAPEVALLALLEVIFGIALAWLGANEKPAASVLTGGAMVIGALLFNELLALRGRRTTMADQAVPGAH